MQAETLPAYVWTTWGVKDAACRWRANEFFMRSVFVFYCALHDHCCDQWWLFFWCGIRQKTFKLSFAQKSGGSQLKKSEKILVLVN